MALRMNLYGCKIAAVHEAIGSKSDTLLETASAHIMETLNDESARAKAISWLRTLIHTGYPLKKTRPQPSVPDDGSLLISHLETEVHVFALHCLIQSIRRKEWIDLAGQSSQWSNSAVSTLHNELVACGFTKSPECSIELLGSIESLNHGTPVFGDDFRTDWSYYSLLRTDELAEFVQAIQRALEFERSVPGFIPDHVRKSMVVRLSNDAREFATELSGWFREIADLDQDAYILWW